MSERLNATVERRHDVHDALSILRVVPDTRRPFTPGQHIELGFPDASGALVIRYYSIVSAPSDPCLEIYAGLSKEDRAAIWPHPGARVFIGEPSGGGLSLKPVPNDALVVFLATGTGVAPFVSMLRAGAHYRRMILVHAVREARDLGYNDELTAHEGLTYLPIVSRDPTWTGRTGRIYTALDDLPEPLDPARTHVFACGNPEMIREVETRLLARGFTTGTNLHVERY